MMKYLIFSWASIQSNHSPIVFTHGSDAHAFNLLGASVAKKQQYYIYKAPNIILHSSRSY